MANYRVKARQFCAGRVYEVGDYCDENTAAALGSDAELVDGDGGSPAHETKPLTAAQLKKQQKAAEKAAAEAADADAKAQAEADAEAAKAAQAGISGEGDKSSS